MVLLTALAWAPPKAGDFSQDLKGKGIQKERRRMKAFLHNIII